MKYDIHVNQRAIIEHDLDIDLTDGAILGFCREFAADSNCKFMFEDGHRYYWFSHKLICDQLPILRIKPDTAYRRMKGLCDKKFIAAHPQNKQMNASWYRFLPATNLLFQTTGKKSDGSDSTPKVPEKTTGSESEPSEQNPNPTGRKSDGPPEENPMYNNTIDTKGDKDKKLAGSNEPEKPASQPAVSQSQNAYQPGEVPEAVRRNREALGGAYQKPPVIPQTPDDDVDWCMLNNNWITQRELRQKLYDLHAGSKGDAFRAACTTHTFSEYVELFITRRAANFPFRSQGGLASIFRQWSEIDLPQEERKAAEAANPSTQPNRKPNTYEVELDD